MNEEEEKAYNKKDKSTYIMVPRKAVIAIIAAFICLYVGFISSIMWSNFIDRRSNQRWCGMVTMFDSTYKEVPPTTDLGRRVASEFSRLREEFDCR